MRRRLSLSLALLSAGCMAVLPVQAQSPRPPQALAVLLKQLKAQPLGLYDGTTRTFTAIDPPPGALPLPVVVKVPTAAGAVVNVPILLGQP